MNWQTNAPTQPVALSNETANVLSAFNGDQNALIVAWRNKMAEFVKVQEAERLLRKAVFECKFPTPKEGVQRFELGNGYALKAQYPYTYKVDEGKAEGVLDKIAALSPVASVIADRLVKWKPEVSIKEYRLIVDKAETDAEAKGVKELFDAILTIRPGMPQLEIEEPKAK